MKLQYVTPDRRVPDDICYFIDCAVECLDLTYDEAFWLRYICTDPGPLVNGPTANRPARHHPEDMYVETGLAINRTKNAYTKWWNNYKTPIDLKLICAAVGTSGIRYVLNQTAKWITEYSIIEQGREYLYPTTLDTEAQCVRKYKAHKISAEGHRRASNGHFPIEVKNWKTYIDGIVPTKNLKDIRAVIERCATLETWADEVSIIVTPQRRMAWRQYDRSERKQIRRGIRLLSDLIGEDAMRDFMRTKRLDIQGEKFTLRLDLENLKESHGGAKTRVFVGEDEICSLCIFTPDTPILDHVASLITHVQAGLEDDLIEIGNPYGIMAKEPTGIEVLDKKIVFKPIDMERVTVCDVIYPKVSDIYVGDSPFAKRLQARAIRRISGYIWNNHFNGTRIRQSKVCYSYPRELQTDEYFNIPPGLVMHSDTPGLHGDIADRRPYYQLDALTAALTARDQIDAGYGEAPE